MWSVPDYEEKPAWIWSCRVPWPGPPVLIPQARGVTDPQGAKSRAGGGVSRCGPAGRSSTAGDRRRQRSKRTCGRKGLVTNLSGFPLVIDISMIASCWLAGIYRDRMVLG